MSHVEAERQTGPACGATRAPSMEVAMLSSVRSQRPRRGVVATTACIALLGATASAAQASPDAAPVCPDAYGIWTLEDGLVRYAGYLTEQEIRSGFAEHDANGNGILCNKIWAHDRFYPFQLLLDDLPS